MKQARKAGSIDSFRHDRRYASLSFHERVRSISGDRTTSDDGVRASFQRHVRAMYAREVEVYRGPVLRHSAELIQAANFRSAVAF